MHRLLCGPALSFRLFDRPWPAPENLCCLSKTYLILAINKLLTISANVFLKRFSFIQPWLGIFWSLLSAELSMVLLISESWQLSTLDIIICIIWHTEVFRFSRMFTAGCWSSRLVIQNVVFLRISVWRCIHAYQFCDLNEKWVLLTSNLLTNFWMVALLLSSGFLTFLECLNLRESIEKLNGGTGLVDTKSETMNISHNMCITEFKKFIFIFLHVHLQDLNW